MKKVFLEELPMKNGIGINKDKKTVDWKKSIGKTVKYIYDDIEGYVEIVSYEKQKKRYLTIRHNSKEYDIFIGSFVKCSLGVIVGSITSEYKYTIGQNIVDEKRDITVLEQKRNSIGHKTYKYKCNKCGFNGNMNYYSKQVKKEELWIEETTLYSGVGCSCCCVPSQIVVEGINDLNTTNEDIIPHLVNKEDSFKYTRSSGNKIELRCQDCGATRLMGINKFCTSGFSCKVCSDGLPFTEKVVINVLKQLEVEFIPQYSQKNCGWIKDRRKYDFYLPNTNTIIEVHGGQHYSEGFCRGFSSARTLEEEQMNDIEKKLLAINNGVTEDNYIVIDARKSTVDFIRESIVNSTLCLKYDLLSIDWNLVNEESQKSIVKKVCEYWNITTPMTRKLEYVGSKFDISKNTVINYLKKGNKFGWCYYEPSKRGNTDGTK